MKKAVVLLSGGIDSTTTLYYTLNCGYKPYCLIFDYGQRHNKEIECAKKIARLNRCGYKIVKFNLPWKCSSLLDRKIPIPCPITHRREIIPSTYVPARNTIFLSFAVSYAEVIGADTIFIGANIIDYSGYPDCKPEYLKSFEKTVAYGTRAGVMGKKIKIKAPFLNYKKSEIIKFGLKHGVLYEFTWSCYRGGKTPCLRCDSCKFRMNAFKELNLEDPLLVCKVRESRS